MTRQYRQGDSPVCSIGRIPDRHSTVPSNGARGGPRAMRDRASRRNTTGGNSGRREPVKREPGATLELLFRQDPDLKPGPFLAYLERSGTWKSCGRSGPTGPSTACRPRERPALSPHASTRCRRGEPDMDRRAMKDIQENDTRRGSGRCGFCAGFGQVCKCRN
jgi:hypothetical protein